MVNMSIKSDFRFKKNTKISVYTCIQIHSRGQFGVKYDFSNRYECQVDFNKVENYGSKKENWR